MSIVLDGTTGITTPGLTNTGTETIVNLTTSGNTILGDASTDTLNVGNGGLVKDASGNVGIGVTPSAWGALVPALQIGTGGSFIAAQGATPALYIGANAHYNGSNWVYKVTEASSYYSQYQGYHSWANAASGTAGSAISFLTRMTLDTSGNLLLGTTDAGTSTGVGIKLLSSPTVSSMGIVANTAGNLNTYHLFNTNATNNSFRFYVNINGGIYNFSGNNSNLSDERSKTNIEMAGGYLEKMCAIPVKLFNYKDEPTGAQRTLGVIAQDVEAVAPELVNNDGFGETPEGEAPLKSIYTTDMMYALMKCIQEQQALITALTDRITALENK
jgi:hypothetical protein